MRISDWSSDVCSSDLAGRQQQGDQRGEGGIAQAAIAHRLARHIDIDLQRAAVAAPGQRHVGLADHDTGAHQRVLHHIGDGLVALDDAAQDFRIEGQAEVARPARQRHLARSEEHTSELQSLMRISYAVFCLKKKTTISTYNPIYMRDTSTDTTDNAQ